ncbi:MAG: hypothetical protein LBN18_04640 [Dysgonamonadaceae bacterium]|jgi:hypothetical protein|nr:hypothetical protein [Dysgonamonadaceae bacterium]
MKINHIISTVIAKAKLGAIQRICTVIASEAKQSKGWIASGFTLAMTKRFAMTKLIVFGLLLWTSVQIYAQPAIIKASIDSTQILIGEQTKIRLEIVTDPALSLKLPMPADSLVKGIEIIEISSVDTADLGTNRLSLKYDFLVTSFDSALYLIPPFQLIAGLDTIYSNELALKVATLPVDTESRRFYDIKDVMTPRWVWTDYIWYVLIPLFGLIALGLIAYLIYWLTTQKKPVVFKKEEPALPPHVVALKALDEIKDQKLWQQGKAKLYHSEITDTLRKYMERRFSIAAMESTSGEILEQLQQTGAAGQVYEPLKQILQLADFVKFAKYQPLPGENELSLTNAYLFVNGTKQEESLPPELSLENNEKVKV